MDGIVAGYLLYSLRKVEYLPEHREVYIRQFFVEPKYRGKGLGSLGFERAAREWFPPDADLVLDVLESNQRGRQFWERLGFEPYYTNLRRGRSRA
jgi:GNAT superfamily N-acetyltransferase